MLVNATQSEELRVAMVDGQRLYDLDIESESREQKKANIYKGRITRIEPSLDAAFIDYGADRHGFLPFKEVSPEYYLNEPASGRPNIREVLREGQEIVVQVEKEERGNKGAALTTYISLAGRFIVLMPNNPRAGGVSRRVSGEDRDDLREVLDDIEIPAGMGVIVRTAGVGRAAEEIKWDLDYLLGIWEAIKAAVVSRPASFLIFQDSNAIIRALRDHLANDIGEIIIDDDKAFEEARQFVERAMPHNLRKLKQYTDPVPLFTRYQIESQIESAFAHTVELPSGGSIVIDHTEALVSIDINSARATKGDDIEATAFQTNLEAADEIARQLRLRDLGGLIVIDFIDMGPQRNQREVENRLRDAVRMDRARVQIGRISRFGLLEMSRQRLRPSLGESAHQTCPRCKGMGSIRSVDSLALAVLRLVGEEARKDRTAKVIAQLPVDVANYLLNEKREWISTIESRDHIQLLLVADSALETPDFILRRVRDDQVSLPENTGASYTLVTPTTPRDAAELEVVPAKARSEGPAVASVLPSTPAPVVAAPPEAEAPPAAAAPQQPGVFVRMWNWLFAPGAPVVVAASTDSSADRERGRSPDRNRDRERGQRNDRPGERSGRHERGDRNDRRRGQRGERGERRDDSQRDRPRDERRTTPAGGERPEPRSEPRAERTERPQRTDRMERTERPDRGARPDRAERPESTPRTEPTEAAAAGSPPGVASEERPGGVRSERGRRRRRGGRDRDGRGPREPGTEPAEPLANGVAVAGPVLATIAGEAVAQANSRASAADSTAAYRPADGGQVAAGPDAAGPDRDPSAPGPAAWPPAATIAPAAPATPAPFMADPEAPTPAMPARFTPATSGPASGATAATPPLPAPPVAPASAATTAPIPSPSPAPAESAVGSTGPGPYIERGTDRLLPWETPRPDKRAGTAAGNWAAPVGGDRGPDAGPEG
jgi:ribonuclease E